MQDLFVLQKTMCDQLVKYMKNYFNFAKFEDDYLITNDAGRFAFLKQNEFMRLLQDRISPEESIGKRLIRDGFISDQQPIILSDLMKDSMRDSHNYLFAPTSLHIFIVTTVCNSRCIYCQAQDGKSSKCDGMMSFAVSEKAVDIALSAPADYLTFEFQGGEPLANFPTIQHIVEYANKHCGSKRIEYSLVSNLTLLTEDIADYLAKHNISVSTSLDGPQYLHNQNRPYKNGDGAYDDVIKGIKLCRNKKIIPGAIETTTRYSFSHVKGIINCYIDNGFDNLFIRPLTPLGCANADWKDVGYEPEEFISFYRECLAYIIRLNQAGTFIIENYAKLFLSKILTGHAINYMELRSPCGAGIGQMAYYWDGNIYTCDEGRMLSEMGDKSFLLGNVFNTDYQKIMDSASCRAVCKASILESLPCCCDCVYQPYCGVCPVINLALEKDILSKHVGNYRCKIYKGMLSEIFHYLHSNDPSITKVFGDWLC